MRANAHHTPTWIEDGEQLVDALYVGYVRYPVHNEWDNGGGFAIIFDDTLPVEE